MPRERGYIWAGLEADRTHEEESRWGLQPVWTELFQPHL